MRNEGEKRQKQYKRLLKISQKRSNKNQKHAALMQQSIEQEEYHRWWLVSYQTLTPSLCLLNADACMKHCFLVLVGGGTPVLDFRSVSS
jgi:hypothetical protein